jgi:hypothetical protein
MRKINDSRLYLYFGAVTLALALVVGAISSYSIFSVEPGIRALLNAPSDINGNYRKAYLFLRNPQIFAGYERFDAEGSGARRFIEHFDEAIYSGSEITADQKQYLELLLERRQGGSALGIKTMFYILLVSFLSWIMYFVEKRQAPAPGGE